MAVTVVLHKEQKAVGCKEVAHCLGEYWVLLVKKSPEGRIRQFGHELCKRHYHMSDTNPLDGEGLLSRNDRYAPRGNFFLSKDIQKKSAWQSKRFLRLH